ncbi:hypothetical protein KKH14_03045 [Patescibacteria group bacterium]|nr:hypothetical protein [Patescibacteria group bacterium]
MNNDLKAKLGDKWLVFNKLHQFILSLSPEMECRLCTVYVRYMLGNNIIAVVYFRGKFVSSCQLDVGFAFKGKPKNHSFINAKYMNYPNINYSIKLKNSNDITKKLTDIIKSMIILNPSKKSYAK